MSDHSLAFVPLGTGYVQSTDLFARGRPVDTGLLAEALIYYDRILISVENPHQFSSLVSYLIQQGLTVANIIALFRDGVFGVYDFAFHTNPYVDFQPDGIKIHGLYNLQDQTMLKPKCGNLLPLWSSATCRHHPHNAARLHGLGTLTDDCDRSQMAKALTGQRTPKRDASD